MKIPVSVPSLSGNEEAYLVDALRSSWISSSGHYVDRFEAEFARLTQTAYAASVANGTAALHLALAALEVGRGDEIIVPALTYVATANAVKYCGAEPVLVDVDPLTWCIDPDRVVEAITPKTKGIIVVHLYGHPCDMDAIGAIAAARGLFVIEDAAEAHFAKYKGRTVGSLSTVGVFSFYGNKIVTSGEGGALTYNDPDLDRRIRMLRSHGMDPAHRYYHPVIGFNYRLTNLACSLLCAQLERHDELIARRRAIFEIYDMLLTRIPGIGLQPVATWAEPSPWLFCMTVDEAEFGMDRDKLSDHLREHGIDSRPFFVPLHLMPPFHDCGAVGRFPTSERLGRIGINLPTYVDLTSDDVRTICGIIDDIRSTGRV